MPGSSVISPVDGVFHFHYLKPEVHRLRRDLLQQQAASFAFKENTWIGSARRETLLGQEIRQSFIPAPGYFFKTVDALFQPANIVMKSSSSRYMYRNAVVTSDWVSVMSSFTAKLNMALIVLYFATGLNVVVFSPRFWE